MISSESANEADYFVRRCHRRNSGLVVAKREAQAQGLIDRLFQPQQALPLAVNRNSHTGAQDI